MSSVYDYDFKTAFDVNYKNINSKIFYSDFARNVLGYGVPIQINLNQYQQIKLSLIGICKEMDRAFRVIDEGLYQLGGVTWINVS